MSITDLNPPISAEDWTSKHYVEVFGHFTPVEKTAIHIMMNAYVQECLRLEAASGIVEPVEKEMD
jgi:hypothetical protein